MVLKIHNCDFSVPLKNRTLKDTQSLYQNDLQSTSRAHLKKRFLFKLPTFVSLKSKVTPRKARGIVQSQDCGDQTDEIAMFHILLYMDMKCEMH